MLPSHASVLTTRASDDRQLLVCVTNTLFADSDNSSHVEKKKVRPRGQYRVFVLTPLPSHAHSPCAFTTHTCTPEALWPRLTPIHVEGTSAVAPRSGDVLRCVPHVGPACAYTHR